jgi:N-acetylmuramoyl-L-alanine amidase
MRLCIKDSFLTFALALCSAVAAEPRVAIVSPAAGACVSAAGRTFVIGSVTPPDTPLTVNGQAVTPWRTGGFLFMSPVTPGTNTLVVRAGATAYRHTFTVPYPPPAWDGKSLRAQLPLHPLGVQTNEPIRLECLAPTGLVVCAAVGERTVLLSPQAKHPTRYAGSVTFAAPAENVPVTFFAGSLPDAAAASLTARSAWSAHSVTGGLFEVRARTAPGDGDTVAFLPPGLCMQGAGFIGEHTRFWLANNLYYTETRHTAPAPSKPLPPRDLPLPDLALGYGPCPPTNTTPASLLIMLDPGHGGSATGAIGPTGIPEKLVTLQQANVVKSVLEHDGFRVRLTRETDTDLDLYERVRLAYSEKAAAFISIHYNSCAPSTNPREVRHIATYFWSALGKALAQAIHPRVAAVTATFDSGIRAASFAVCRNPAIPSILIELDFISTPEGEEAIQMPEQQRRVADAILAGLRDWLASPAAPAPIVPLIKQGPTL